MTKMSMDKMAEIKKVSGRDAYGTILRELGHENKDIMVLAADAISSTRGNLFAQDFPERSFNFGIAEANMVTAAAGMAVAGKIPVAAAYGFLLSMRTAEQVRTNICYPNLNVKLVSTATGLSMGDGGTTHHCTEDLAIMRSFANIIIVSPSSSIETALATRKVILEYEGPVYLRLIRGKGFDEIDNFYMNNDVSFEIGTAITLQEGKDITIVATGEVVNTALNAGRMLAKEGIEARVLDMHTIKPVDADSIRKASEETGGIITVEEHTTVGGLGDAVSSVLSMKDCCSTKLYKIGIQDRFCGIGPTEDLWEKEGISESNIVSKAKELLA